MQYYAEKSIEFRLEEARLARKNLDLVRQEEALRASRRPVWRPSPGERLGKWTATRVRRWTRNGGAA